MAVITKEYADQLLDWFRWQDMPGVFSTEDSVSIVIQAIERLFVDTGRYTEYDGFIATRRETTEYPEFEYDLPLDEKLYVLCLCKILLTEMIQRNKNDMVSYTTDALSITQGDKPFANLQQNLNDLEKERRRLFYAMARYTIAES